MKLLTTLFLLILLATATPQLHAQTDTVPSLGGIVLDADTFASIGEPRAVTRSSRPGSKKSLLEKAGIKVFNQRCELSCGSCAVTSAVMVRRKMYCDPRCKCNFPVEVFSWSYLHNQLVKMYGRDNIRLINVLDLLQKQGIMLAESSVKADRTADSFPNTPCSHDRQPDDKDRSKAAQNRYWTYEPIFRAKKYIPGSPEQKEALFREQLVPKTIAWIDFGIPVIAGLLVTENFRRLNPQDCLWDAPNSLTGAKGHALLVMGYDDTTAEFEVLNSYGTGWGCEGIARISYVDYTRTVQEGYVLKFDFETGKKVDCPKK